MTNDLIFTLLGSFSTLLVIFGVILEKLYPKQKQILRYFILFVIFLGTTLIIVGMMAGVLGLEISVDPEVARANLLHLTINTFLIVLINIKSRH